MRHLRRAASRFRRARLETLAHGADSIRVGDSSRDRTVAKLARERQRLGTVGGDVQRNPVVEVDKAPIAMQVPYLAAQPFGVVDRFAVLEQIANHAHLLAELRLLDRRQSHHAPASMASAES